MLSPKQKILNVKQINLILLLYLACNCFYIYKYFVSGTGFLVAPGDNSPDSPGELGRPVVLPTNMSAEMKRAVDEGWLKNAFNQYASDLISVHRGLPDPRDPW